MSPWHSADGHCALTLALQHMSTSTTLVNTNSTTTVALADATRLLQLAASMELGRMENSELRAKYIALLPIATAEQFALVQAAAAGETEAPEGCKMNVDFKLSSEQEQILEAVREERRKHLMENKEKYVSEIAADSSQKLVSLKVRVGTKKTTTTMRFEKSIAKPTGLIAHLRNLTELL